ncbi:MAG TPA: GNAT family N-acetyltransferase [Myxococcaceae bacterium]|nr:GNAT family N-acetyltransferase [Myxococcaceae bacterium]
MGIHVEPLGRQHRGLLKGFQNQHASLTEYLQRYALRHAEKDLLARTYVAIDVGQEGPRLAGYFSLATVSVERSAAGKVPTLERLPRFPIPGVLLARLAVDQRVQGQGLGRFLFDEALGRTLQLAQSGPVAFRLFVTDALDAQAARFYERFGLMRLADEYPCRMVLDLLPLLTRQSE